MERYKPTVQRTDIVLAGAGLQRIDACHCCLEVRVQFRVRQPISAAAINRGLYHLAHERSRLRCRSGLTFVTRRLVGIGYSWAVAAGAMRPIIALQNHLRGDFPTRSTVGAAEFPGLGSRM